MKRLILLFLLALTGCASQKPVHVEPPSPPKIEKPKPQLKAGDWIIKQENGETFICHRPAQHIQVRSKAEHVIIECRK